LSGSPEFPATWAGGHALIIEFGDEELLGRCQCGEPFGAFNPTQPLDRFGPLWERHVMGPRVPRLRTPSGNRP
jgi:hypothetical protein